MADYGAFKTNRDVPKPWKAWFNKKGIATYCGSSKTKGQARQTALNKYRSYKREHSVAKKFLSLPRIEI